MGLFTPIYMKPDLNLKRQRKALEKVATIADPDELCRIALNAPVPMLIIGFYLAAMDWRTVLRRPNEYPMLALRLLIVPALVLGVLWLCRVRGILLIANVVCISAPVATMCTMFATKYEVDPTLSAGMVAVSTLLSILTMTLVVGFARFVA